MWVVCFRCIMVSAHVPPVRRPCAARALFPLFRGGARRRRPCPRLASGASTSWGAQCAHLFPPTPARALRVFQHPFVYVYTCCFKNYFVYVYMFVFVVCDSSLFISFVWVICGFYYIIFYYILICLFFVLFSIISFLVCSLFCFLLYHYLFYDCFVFLSYGSSSPFILARRGHFAVVHLSYGPSSPYIAAAP